MSDLDFIRIYNTLHVLSVALLAGGITIDTVVGPLMVRATSVQELRAFTRLSRIAEDYIMLPAFLLIVGFGYATAGRQDRDLGDTWLLVAQILTFIAAAGVIGYLRSASLRVDRLARAVPDGPVPESLTRAMKNPGPPIVGTILTVGFVFILYLMVAQPRW